MKLACAPRASCDGVMIRRCLAVFALLALSTGCPAASPPSVPPLASATSATSAPAPKRAPVVVAFVIDQFGAWVAEERLPKLPSGGFFARMVREGTWVHAMRYPYATTDTAPGHTSLHTGRIPAESGIVMNEVIESTHGWKVSVLHDPATKLVTPAGVQDATASSVGRLLVPTVGDRLIDAHPRAKVISVSLKDRSSLLPAGHHPTHALFFETKDSTFVTTTAVESTFPAWAVESGGRAAIEKSYETNWDATDPKWLAANAGKDNQEGEGDLFGLGTVFSHVVKNAPSFRASPKSDAAILDIGLAGALAEHDPTEPMLILLSMSAHDVIGHTFGPDSWESWDQLAKLDIAMEQFMEKLEAKVGPVAVVLSADHGTVSMPETRKLPCTQPKDDPWNRPLCIPGGRIMPGPLRADLEAATKAKLGKGQWIGGISDGYIYFTGEAKALPADRRALLHTTVEGVLHDKKYASFVGEIDDVRALTEKCPAILKAARGIPDRARADEPMEALVCRSWRENAGAGDVYVVPSFGSYWDGEIVSGKGTNHGSPYLHDRTIPFFARGPGITAGRSVKDPVDFSAYSAVYAALLGLDSKKPDAIIDSLTAR